MEITKAKGLVFYARDWVYEANGCDEDGRPNYVTVWQVLAEATSGRRWVLDTFGSDDKDSADRFINCVSDLVKTEGSEGLTSDHWSSTDPRYGSNAWVDIEAEEIAPVALTLSSGRLNEADVPEAIASYF
jgi:hypothetical protein